MAARTIDRGLDNALRDLRIALGRPSRSEKEVEKALQTFIKGTNGDALKNRVGVILKVQPNYPTKKAVISKWLGQLAVSKPAIATAFPQLRRTALTPKRKPGIRCVVDANSYAAFTRVPGVPTSTLALVTPMVKCRYIDPNLSVHTSLSKAVEDRSVIESMRLKSDSQQTKAIKAHAIDLTNKLMAMKRAHVTGRPFDPTQTFVMLGGQYGKGGANPAHGNELQIMMIEGRPFMIIHDYRRVDVGKRRAPVYKELDPNLFTDKKRGTVQLIFERLITCMVKKDELVSQQLIWDGALRSLENKKPGPLPEVLTLLEESGAERKADKKDNCVQEAFRAGLKVQIQLEMYDLLLKTLPDLPDKKNAAFRMARTVYRALKGEIIQRSFLGTPHSARTPHLRQHVLNTYTKEQSAVSGGNLAEVMENLGLMIKGGGAHGKQVQLIHWVNLLNRQSRNDAAVWSGVPSAPPAVHPLPSAPPPPGPDDEPPSYRSLFGSSPIPSAPRIEDLPDYDAPGIYLGDVNMTFGRPADEPQVHGIVDVQRPRQRADDYLMPDGASASADFQLSVSNPVFDPDGSLGFQNYSSEA